VSTSEQPTELPAVEQENAPVQSPVESGDTVAKPPVTPPSKKQPQTPGINFPSTQEQLSDVDLRATALQTFSMPTTSAAPKENEDFTRLISVFKDSSTKWTSIQDAKQKELIVYYFISEFQDAGIKIKKSPFYYVSMIDSMAAQSPEMLAHPLSAIIQVVAIIEYDFDNGQDKDAMAKGILGEEGFLRNKARLGIQ
jgi:hypothetical protein